MQKKDTIRAANMNTIAPATPNTLPRCTEYMPIEICLPNDWDAYSL